METVALCVAVLAPLTANAKNDGDGNLMVSEGTLKACEDILNGICKTEEHDTTIPTGGTDAMVAADQLYKTGPGYVRGIEMSWTYAAATVGTIALRDNTVAGAEQASWSRGILAADYSVHGVKADLQTDFAVGLFLDFTTTTDLSCMVRYR